MLTGRPKLAVLVAVPPGPMTATGPVVDPAATVAVIFESETTVTLCAGVPLMVTPVAPAKPEPLIVSDVPTLPFNGVNEVIFGPTVNEFVLVTFPAGLVMVIGPVSAP